MSVTKEREAVLLMTHFIDDMIVEKWRRMNAEAGDRDVFILLNKTDDINPSYRRPPDIRVFEFTVSDIRALGYPVKGHKIRDRDIELFAFTFWKKHPEYKHTWIIEYDTDFTSPWYVIFDHFKDSKAAILATAMHDWTDCKDWDNWPTVQLPNGEKPTDLSPFIRSFHPFWRLSREGFQCLDRAYHQGWEGFYEGIMAYLLLQEGLEIEDIGGPSPYAKPENRGKWYSCTLSSDTLGPGTFIFRPIYRQPGPEKNMLYHPVKPEKGVHTKGWPIRRRDQIVHRTRALAKQSIAKLKQNFVKS